MLQLRLLLGASCSLCAAYHWDIKERAICIALLSERDMAMMVMLIDSRILTPAPAHARGSNLAREYDVSNS